MRIPDEYREPVSGRKAKKWEKIISLFMESAVQIKDTGRF